MNGIPGSGDRKLKPLDPQALKEEGQKLISHQVGEMRKQGVPEAVIQDLLHPQSMQLGSTSFQEQAAGRLSGPQQIPQPTPLATSAQPPLVEDSRSNPLPEGGFDASMGGATAEDKQHPVLKKLETAFGLKKLKCESFKLAGFSWRFRPPAFRSYEWMSQNVELGADGTVPAPTLQLTNVASALAAINGTPLYEVFGISTTARYIPDPNYPPPDIRAVAAETFVEWVRDDVGLWELIPKLDSELDELFEKSRETSYPLVRALEMEQSSPASTDEKTPMQRMNGGKAGAELSPSSDGSQLTQEPMPSSMTTSPENSSSTGETERERETETKSCQS